MPFGRVEFDDPTSGRDFRFTREHALQAVAWFKSMGRDLAIDFDHEMYLGVAGAKAAGWISGFDVRPDGLYATGVKFTPDVHAAIAHGEYRYFSPVIIWTDEKWTDIRKLGPVALTNNPAMKGVSSLAANSGSSDDAHVASTTIEIRAARAAKEKPVKDFLTKLATALGVDLSEHGDDESAASDAVVAAIATMKADNVKLVAAAKKGKAKPKKAAADDDDPGDEDKPNPLAAQLIAMTVKSRNAAIDGLIAKGKINAKQGESLKKEHADAEVVAAAIKLGGTDETFDSLIRVLDMNAAVVAGSRTGVQTLPNPNNQPSGGGGDPFLKVQQAKYGKELVGA